MKNVKYSGVICIALIAMLGMVMIGCGGDAPTEEPATKPAGPKGGGAATKPVAGGRL